MLPISLPIYISNPDQSESIFLTTSDVSTASKAPEIQYLEFSTDHFSPKSGFFSGSPCLNTFIQPKGAGLKPYE